MESTNFDNALVEANVLLHRMGLEMATTAEDLEGEIARIEDRVAVLRSRLRVMREA